MLVSGPGQKSFTLHLFVDTQALYGRSSFNSLWLCLHPETPESWMSREGAVDFKQKSNVSSSRWDTSCTRKVLHLPYKITILRAWTSRKFVKGNVFPVYKQKMKTYLATNCNFSNIPDCSTNFKGKRTYAQTSLEKWDDIKHGFTMLCQTNLINFTIFPNTKFFQIRKRKAW